MNYLIVGLGNIGDEYDNTRHNIGFEVLDQLAEKKELVFKMERLAAYTKFRFKGRSFHLIKPSTYMNLSGKAVRYWMDKLKIKQENVMVVVDDIALPFGKLRMKKKGGTGGHNGLKNIEQVLGNANYVRLRFGIGDEYSKGKQIGFVLGKWSPEEQKKLEEPIKKCHEIITAFATIGTDRTMNQFN